MVDVMEEMSQYVSEYQRFESSLSEKPRSGLSRIRKSALARFEELGFPTIEDEEWRFTPVAPLAEVPFKLARLESPTPADSLEGIVRLVGPDAIREGMVFVNGQCAQPFAAALPPGVVVMPLARMLREHPEKLEPYLARYAKCDDHAFTALNTAFLRDGTFVHVPRGVIVDRPIHLVYVSSAQDDPTMSHPRNLIVLDSHAQATIVESYVGREGEVYFTNAVSEFTLAEGAKLDHCKLQQESKEAFHVSTMQIHQEQGSVFSTHSISFGGRLVRNEVNAILDAEKCECTLNGLYVGAGEQLIDNHTRIDHAKPHCASHELYKGILDDRARGVFNGKIYVHPDAQKTDAKQTNKTLLLSDDAVIDTKPQLEIFADDVKCTHGATIGHLDKNALFYLRSRGLGLEESRGLLTFAFANDITSRIKVADIRARLEEFLLTMQRLPQGEEVA